MGLWSTIFGFVTVVYDVIHPDKFLTIFDLDYEHKRALARANKCNRMDFDDEDIQFNFD